MTSNTPQHTHTQTTARPRHEAGAMLARIRQDDTGELVPGAALMAADKLLFGPSGPGLSYVPYLAAEGESLIAVRRYADALHFEAFFTPEQLAARKADKAVKLEVDWQERLRDPKAAYEADQAKADKAKAGRRGVIKGFSTDSRRRMSRECAKVHDLAKASFVTLTLSDEIVGRFLNRQDTPDTEGMPDYLQDLVEDLDKRKHKPAVDQMADYLREKLAALDKRGQRRWTRGEHKHTFGFLWKIENQRRKSGLYEGQLVPHVHLIVTGLGSVAVTRQRLWLKAIWWALCGQASDGHKQAGVQLDKVYSRAGAGVYVAKYVSKTSDDAEDAELEIGRRWGMRGTVDTSGEDVAIITLMQYVQVRRYVARWLQNRWKGGRRYARTIRRPRQSDHALFIFGGGFESMTGWRLSESLMRSVGGLEGLNVQSS